MRRGPPSPARCAPGGHTPCTKTLERGTGTEDRGHAGAGPGEGRGGLGGAWGETPRASRRTPLHPQTCGLDWPCCSEGAWRGDSGGRVTVPQALSNMHPCSPPETPDLRGPCSLGGGEPRTLFGQGLGTLPEGLAPGPPQTTGSSPSREWPKDPHGPGAADWDDECGPPPAQEPSVHLECGGLRAAGRTGTPCRVHAGWRVGSSTYVGPAGLPAAALPVGREGARRGQSFKGQKRLCTPSPSSLGARPILGERERDRKEEHCCAWRKLPLPILQNPCPGGPRPHTSLTHTLKGRSLIRQPVWREPQAAQASHPLPGASLKGLPPDTSGPAPTRCRLRPGSPRPKGDLVGSPPAPQPSIQLSLGAPRPRQALGQLQRVPRPLRVPRLTQPPTPPLSSSWWASLLLREKQAPLSRLLLERSLSAALLSLRSHPQWPVAPAPSPELTQGLQPIPCHLPT